MKEALLKAYERLKAFFIHDEQVAAKVVTSIEADAPEIEKFTSQAIPVVDEILKMVGTKTAAEVQTVIDKFNSHFTAAVADDPIQLNHLITASATQALSAAEPSANIENIQLGVTAALNLLNKSKSATAAQAATA